MPDVCQSDVALVDENGMIHWCERYWWIGPADVDHHPLAGKGLIVGAPDADGKFTSCRSTIATRPQTDPPLRGSGEVVEAKAPVCYICVMKRDEAISRLQQHEADLKRLGVEHLYMFGSTARDEAADASDIDLFFDHEKGKLGLFELMT
jgi:Nucleotidyltransferase domain